MLLFRVDRDYFTSLGDIIIEFFIKCVPGKGGSVSQDHQFHTGTGDRYVHAPQVVQEAYLSILVGPYQTDQMTSRSCPWKPSTVCTVISLRKGLKKASCLINLRMYCTCAL